jgi:hypothetical protein
MEFDTDPLHALNHHGFTHVDINHVSFGCWFMKASSNCVVVKIMCALKHRHGLTKFV